MAASWAGIGMDVLSSTELDPSSSGSIRATSASDMRLSDDLVGGSLGAVMTPPS
jgi:hypothetical protein